MFVVGWEKKHEDEIVFKEKLKMMNTSVFEFGKNQRTHFLGHPPCTLHSRDCVSDIAWNAPQANNWAENWSRDKRLFEYPENVIQCI